MQEEKTKPINKVKEGMTNTIKVEEDELMKAKEGERKSAINSKEKEEGGEVIRSPKERADKNSQRLATDRDTPWALCVCENSFL